MHSQDLRLKPPVNKHKATKTRKNYKETLGGTKRKPLLFQGVSNLITASSKTGLYH